MNQARYNHACATLRDEDGIITTIVVAGGYLGYISGVHRYLRTVELLTVGNRTFTTKCDDLPQLIYYGAVVAANPRDKSTLAYFVGGYNSINLSSIYALSRNLTWTDAGNLKQARRQHVALAPPPGFLPGC